MVVDIANAEPVGLYFAGGRDASGVSQGVASPAQDVLNELRTHLGAGAAYSFVGAADHAVTCLNYGDSTVAAAQARSLSDAEAARTQQALTQARMMVNPAAGILGVATGKSTDHPGEGAVLVYVEENTAVMVPATVDGTRTLVIPTNLRAVAFGSAPQTPLDIGAPLPAPVLNAAFIVKQRVARSLMRQYPAFFGVGVGQSLDNPREAALVIYVDRKSVPAQLPATIDGLRTRYVLMDRLHVTRSYAEPSQSKLHCMPRQPAAPFDPRSLTRPRPLKLN
jgi:hypothetical protein